MQQLTVVTKEEFEEILDSSEEKVNGTRTLTGQVLW
jgi:hypothetical protein